MKYKGIIFDLDGVICSTDEYHYRAWKTLADRLEIPFDREQNNLLRGVSRMDSLDIILEKSSKTYTTDEKTVFAEEKNRLYRELLSELSPADLAGEVRDALHILREKHIPMAIGSSSKNTKFILQRLGLDDFFDAVVDGNQIAHSKPAPEVFLKAAGKLNLSSKDCLVVEDAHAGVEAACAGGFDCAAMGDASGDERATWQLKSFSDILNIC